MDTAQTRLLTLLASLAPLHGLEPRRAGILDIFRELTTESLSDYPGANRHRLSTLTSDGLPFELSLSLSRQASGGLRYGTEAGDLRAPLPERLTRGHETTLRLLAHLGAGQWQEKHRRLFEAIFPQQILPLNGYRFGMWQGMVHRPGHADTLKVYYNLQPWGRDVASVLDKILDVLCSDLDTDKLGAMVHHLPQGARTIFLGTDYGGDGRLRAKIYYRCGTGIRRESITEMLIASGMDAHCPAAEVFVRALAGAQGELPPRSLLIQTGLDSAEQDPALGFYVALNRFFYGDQGAHLQIIKLLTAFGIDASLYEETLQVIAGQGLPADAFRYHTLLGLSLSPRTLRVNIYLKPVVGMSAT